MKESTSPLTILQVEDTPSDAVLTARALRESEIPHTIHVVPNGQRALQFLKHADGFSDAPRPNLVLLDLSLPGMNGQEVLKAIKHDDVLKAIPVVVFTTLSTEDSQRLAYENCANSYVVKPFDLSGFMMRVQSIAAYWSQTSCSLAMSQYSR
jgi:CheY-like chemotaxis protein